MLEVYSVAQVRIERQHTGRRNNGAPDREGYPRDRARFGHVPPSAAAILLLSPDYLMPQLYQDPLFQPGYV